MIENGDDETVELILAETNAYVIETLSKHVKCKKEWLSNEKLRLEEAASARVTQSEKLKKKLGP